MAGSRLRAAREKIRLRWTALIAVGSTIKPPPGPRANVSTADSRSSVGAWRRRLVTSSPNLGAIFSIARHTPSKSSETGVQNARHPPETGCDLFEKLQPFAADFRFESAEPGNVASR